MKRNLLLFAFLVCLFNLGMAQSLVVSSPAEPYDGDANQFLGHSTAVVQNVSNMTVVVKASRTTNSLAPGHSSYFCFAGLCNSESVNISPNNDTLAPGETTSVYVDVLPNGNAGTSNITVNVYDVNNNSENVDTDFIFNFSLVGVEDDLQDDVLPSLSPAWPQPANDIVNINYQLGLGNQTGQLKVYSLLGSEVSTIAINSSEGTIKLNTADVHAGIYFVKLIAGGQEVSTRKVIINH